MPELTDREQLALQLLNAQIQNFYDIKSAKRFKDTDTVKGKIEAALPGFEEKEIESIAQKFAQACEIVTKKLNSGKKADTALIEVGMLEDWPPTGEKPTKPFIFQKLMPDDSVANCIHLQITDVPLGKIKPDGLFERAYKFLDVQPLNPRSIVSEIGQTYPGGFVNLLGENSTPAHAR